MARGGGAGDGGDGGGDGGTERSDWPAPIGAAARHGAIRRKSENEMIAYTIETAQ